jgi:hypothetical protein
MEIKELWGFERFVGMYTYTHRMVTTVRHSAEEAYEKFKNMHVKKRIPFN